MADNVGIMGIGVYLPKGRMTAKEISEKTLNIWSEEAIKDKLGIIEKTMPLDNDGSQEMGAVAAISAIEDAGISPQDIDVIISITEDWKEYPLTTSALYIGQKTGAINAWGIDVQNRCCTSASAIKIAKDMMLSDDDINTVLIAGGYRNCDLVDYTDTELSMMFDLAAGGGALILRKNLNKNLILGSHIISDCSLARSAGVKVGGTQIPITVDNLEKANMLSIMEPHKMKDRLKEVSMGYWNDCIKKAFEKSNLPQKIDYLAVLHFKRSAHNAFLQQQGLSSEQTTYLEHYGHIGQVDQILSLKLGLEDGKIKKGSTVLTLAAGIGYVWAANVILWG